MKYYICIYVKKMRSEDSCFVERPFRLAEQNTNLCESIFYIRICTCFFVQMAIKYMYIFIILGDIKK